MTRLVRLASHIHSDWSDDCAWPLDRLARTLRRVGFDGALICDHDRTMTEERRRELVARCADLTRRGFLMVPGVEYQDSDHVVHLPVFGDVPFYSRDTPLLDIMRDSRRSGGVSVFAHPARRAAFERFDDAWVPHLTGIEVWNRKYDGLQPCRWATEAVRGHGLRPFVALDFHGPRQLYPLAMTVPVTAFDWGAVLEALRTGRCRPTAFGMGVESFENGRAGAATERVERLRRLMAPRIRRIERLVRRDAPPASEDTTAAGPPGSPSSATRSDSSGATA